MKRVVLILGGVPAVLFVALLGLFLFASRDIDPPNTPDLVPERVEVADQDNAYTHFNLAAAAVGWPKDEKKNRLLLDILDGKKSDPKYTADLLARNKRVFRLIDRGLECDVCQGPVLRGTAGENKYFYEWFALGRLLRLQAIQEQEAGRWADATNTCSKLIRLGQLARQEASCLSHYLVGCNLLMMGSAAVEQAAASPDVPEDELRRLAQLLDRVEPHDRSLVKAIKGEYQLHCSLIDATAEGKEGLLEPKNRRLARIRYCFQPNRTKGLSAAVFRHHVKNVFLPPTERTQPNIKVDVWPGTANVLVPNSFGELTVGWICPSVETTMRATSFRNQTYLDALRLVVACRRYEKDHHQLPQTLDALAPEYLSAVPTDARDGKPLRYNREKEIIYSIGDDFEDTGGLETWPSWEDFVQKIHEAEETGSPPPPSPPVPFPCSHTANENCSRRDAPDIVFPIHKRPKKGDSP